MHAGRYCGINIAGNYTKQTVHQNLPCWLVLAIAMAIAKSYEREENLLYSPNGAIYHDSDSF